MTVKELIQKLAVYNLDSKVLYDEEGFLQPILRVHPLSKDGKDTPAGTEKEVVLE